MATINGAIGSSTYTLDYSNKGPAFQLAATLVQQIDSSYSQATTYNPTLKGPHAGALIVTPGFTATRINVYGYGAVIVENNTASSENDTIIGSGSQTVLAGNRGMTFRSTSGDDSIVAGGGNNNINLHGDTSASAIYTGDGNDTIYSSGGASTISAGGGDNLIYLGLGNDSVQVTGNDTVHLGRGDATVTATSGSAYIIGPGGVSNSGFTLTFKNGKHASTVTGGAGSYSIRGGLGGGVFHGGYAGGNVIVGGGGNATIIGGGGNNLLVAGTGDDSLRGSGSGDTLRGGSGTDTLVAGAGNETLIGGSGADTIVAGAGNDSMVAGSGGNTFVLGLGLIHTSNGTVDVIKGFGFAAENDFLRVSSEGDAKYDAAHQSLSGSTDTMTLSDGTIIKIEGVSHILSIGDFKY